jgi:hypothetical protein
MARIETNQLDTIEYEEYETFWRLLYVYACFACYNPVSSLGPSSSLSSSSLPRLISPRLASNITLRFDFNSISTHHNPSLSLPLDRQHTMPPFWTIGCLYGASSVMLGAFGAHGLKKQIADPARIANWGTAAQYQVCS